MEHFDVCNSIYYILIVFYIDIFLHIYQQVDQQKQYLEILKENDENKREEQEKNKKQRIIDKLEKMRENIGKTMNNEDEEEEEEEQRDEKPPDFLREKDPIFLSTNFKSAVLYNTFNLIIIYFILVVNIIPTYFNFYFSLYAIFGAIVNSFWNVIYILYLKYNHSLADDMKDKSFYTVFTMVVFYIYYNTILTRCSNNIISNT